MNAVLPPTLLVLALSVLALSASCVHQADTAEKASSRPTSRPSAVARPSSDPASKSKGPVMTTEIPTTDAEWQRRLTTEQYQVLRKHDTERPFTGEYWDNKKPGAYSCAGCGQLLFDASTKFASGSGWPSFYQPAVEGNVATEADASLGMVRTEVHCGRCGGHLGHRFPDGPQPTGQRYCINSVSLRFAARADKNSVDKK